MIGGARLRAASTASGSGGMLWDYFREYISLLDERRQQRFDSLATGDDVERLGDEVRARISQMWGGLPSERTPLNPAITGTIRRDDYLIEKLIFESRPGFHVTANVYRPLHEEGPLPAVVIPCGHAGESKADENYQRFAILLARHGFIALIYDPVGQGERLQMWSSELGASRVGGGTREHGRLGNACYLLGLNLMHYRAWDTFRAIDYLSSREDVDSQRIAVGGNSGGGMETMQLACMDDRIAGAFVGCAAASFRAKTEATLMADPEQILAGTLRAGVEHQELLAAFAPKPLLLGSPKLDYVPLNAAQKTFAEVQHAYLLRDAEALIAQSTPEAGHGLGPELRDAAVDWFSRWISSKSQDVVERDATISTPEELQATQTGQTVTSLSSKTIQDFNQSRFERIRPQRTVPRNGSEFSVFKNEIERSVKELTRVGSFRPEHGIFVPDRTLEGGPFARGTVVVVSDRGKDDPSLRRTVIDPILSTGFEVVALDLRGWGETRPMGGSPDFNWEKFFAYRALEIGKPLLGQRMKDLLTTSSRRVRRRTFSLVGVGGAGLAVAHAALLSPRIREVVTIGAPVSYRSMLEDPMTTHALSGYVPGVLSAYDVRDLYAAAAPRRYLVVNPLDSQGAPLPASRAWEEYDWAAQAYEAAGAAAQFEMESQLSAKAIREKLAAWLKT